jgi:hypothetical protein
VICRRAFLCFFIAPVAVSANAAQIEGSGASVLPLVLF